ncbi:low-density lipoprotein receptor-like isoform X1 [Oculina patagonica]
MARFRGTVFGILVCLLAALEFYQTIGFRCGEDQFVCANLTCIPENWRCDGDDDCGDNSDEQNCPVKKCDPTSNFQCKTVDRCIPLRWVCDYDNDCGDNSDEPPDCASRTCSDNEHACGNGQCIPKRWLCDRDKDCDDGSDEEGCGTISPGNKTCKANEFTCANGKCITKTWLCDYDNDCGDNSDESHCPNITCSPTQFSCKNGRCIKSMWKCDGDNDCQDNSDEINCPTMVPKCKHSEFQCDDGSCIHKSWKCDGENDCKDHSDEKGCNVTSCSTKEFSCTNGRCIYEYLKCNGNNDCLDNSDERDCPEPTKPCKDGEFRCGDSDQCIPESKVCDAIHDCDNKMDEPMSCGIDECIDHNGHCQQFCNDTKTSYFCSCREGFEIDKEDARVCQDVDECKIPGMCSQVCINTKGSFKCICREGYLMEPDRRTCKAKGEQGYLIFANRQDIRRILFDSSDYTELIPGQRGAIALDYDFDSGYIFWTDVINETVNRAKMEPNPKVEVLVKIALDTPDGIAVDWINRKLYWTDTGTDMIEVADFDGKNRLELIATGLEEPRAIVVHPFLGYMIWTDWGETPKIEKCGMNGDTTTRQVLISTNILWPNALAVDYTIDRIWWADAKLHTIESSDLNGRNRRIILSENINHPFALTIFQSYVYWTDWHHNAINKANKFTGEERSVVMENLFSPMDIHVHHRQRQPIGVNPCQPTSQFGGCSHICLLAPRQVSGPNGYPRLAYPDGFSCHCPPGIHLLYDQRTCNTTDAFKCKENTCLNGGTCVPGKENRELPTCKCTQYYTGKHCEKSRNLPIPPTATTSATHYIPGMRQDPKEEDIGVTVGISIAVVVLILALGVLVGWLVYRRIQRHNRRSMNFDNPVYKKTTESNSSLDRISIHFGHSHGKCQSLLGSFRNDVEVSNC